MPLAHILMPQLARKAQEIENAIGPPRPLTGIGYLQASAPLEMPQVQNPRAPASEKALADLRAEPAQRPDTVFKNAARRAVPGIVSKKKIKPIPLAPPQPGNAVGSADPIGMDENSRPIYASDSPRAAKPKKGQRTVIAIPQQGAVGQNDRGEAVDARGLSLGYLHGGTPNVRTLERRGGDVPVGAKDSYDQFGVATLQRKYGVHLRAMQDNRDTDGMPTDKFPDGHFTGMSKAARKEIEEGVARLRELERGTPI